MTPVTGLQPLGIALAVAFAIMLASILWWMLRLPAPISAEVARAVHSMRAVRRIMVPIMDRFYSERAVELACRLGAGQPTKILLGYVIEVPRTMPLEVPLPAVEERAQTTIEDGLAIVRRHGLIGETSLVRSREAGGGISRAARDYEVDLIVLGTPDGVGLLESIFYRTSTFLLQHAPCEVVVDHVPVGALPYTEAGEGETEGLR